MENSTGKIKKKMGFAVLVKTNPKLQKEIASMGGSSVPSHKRTFSTDPELAARAGRKGGKISSSLSRSFSINKELAIRAGRKGGLAKRGKIMKKKRVSIEDFQYEMVGDPINEEYQVSILNKNPIAFISKLRTGQFGLFDLNGIKNVLILPRNTIKEMLECMIDFPKLWSK